MTRRTWFAAIAGLFASKKAAPVLDKVALVRKWNREDDQYHRRIAAIADYGNRVAELQNAEIARALWGPMAQRFTKYPEARAAAQEIAQAIADDDYADEDF